MSCTQGVKDASDAEAEPRVCLNVRAARSFDALTEKHVYVREGSKAHFLITLRYRCRDLSEAFTIAITDTTGRVCSGGFGKISFQDKFNERVVESCAIKTIERVDDRAHAIRIVESRMGPPLENTGTWTDIPESEDSSESEDTDDSGDSEPETESEVEDRN